MDSAFEAIERIKHEYPTNRQIIAEIIRVELEEARACDDAVSEAQTRVTNAFRQFPNMTVIVPFEITETTNFSRWRVTVRYPVGEAFEVDQDS